jgi:hypothetical protein
MGINAFHPSMPAFLNMPNKPACNPITAKTKMIHPMLIDVYYASKSNIKTKKCSTLAYKCVLKGIIGKK